MDYQQQDNDYIHRPINGLNGYVATDYTSDLNHYYTNEVQLRRDEIKKSVAITMPIVDAILKYINGQDKRFSPQKECVGSYWQGLKVEKPDEFDISVPLNIPEEFVWCEAKDHYFKVDPNEKTRIISSAVPLQPPPTGYVRPQYSSPSTLLWKQSTDLIYDGVIISMCVRNRFKKLLKEAVRSLGLRDEVQVSKKEQGPALTISIKPKGHLNLISVDFAPIHQARLSFASKMKWPRPSARWPSTDKIQKVKDVGVNQVAKRDLEWYFSFAEAEKELIKEIDKDGGNRKKLHRCMKKLNQDVWCPEKKPVISSYVLKNVWFWECEEYPSVKDWDNDVLWQRFLSLTLRLRTALQKRHLQLYFYTDVNLLNNRDPDQLDNAISKIDAFLRNPVKYLNQQ